MAAGLQLLELLLERIKRDMKNLEPDKYIFNSRFLVAKMLNDKTKLLSPNEAMFDAAVDVADEI